MRSVAHDDVVCPHHTDAVDAVGIRLIGVDAGALGGAGDKDSAAVVVIADVVNHQATATNLNPGAVVADACVSGDEAIRPRLDPDGPRAGRVAPGGSRKPRPVDHGRCDAGRRRGGIFPVKVASLVALSVRSSICCFSPHDGPRDDQRDGAAKHRNPQGGPSTALLP